MPSEAVPALRPSFIGRKADLQRLVGCLQDPAVRLLTLVGSGGMGKTRLSLELIAKLKDEFRDGALFVPLAQLDQPAELFTAIAERVGLQSPPGGELKLVLLHYLSSRQMLLVLDNFEHLLDGAVLVNELLAAGPGIKVIVTSRERLNLSVETLYRLHGLELERKESSAEPADAVQLFLQKARQVLPDFSPVDENLETIVQICQLVDGNPLGILFAAAWVEHFSPAEIVIEIRRNLDFLSRNARDIDTRHSSIRAVIESSYHRLDERSKAAFRALASFRGSFDLQAAQKIAGADLGILIALVDKSILRRHSGSGRYSLHELLHQYAVEALEASGEASAVQQAHARYFLALVHEQESLLYSRDQQKAIDRIAADFDNIRQACTWAVDNGEIEAMRAAVPGIYGFCDSVSRFHEGALIFYEACKGLAPRPGQPPHPAWALMLLSWYDLRTYHEPFASYADLLAMAEMCLEQAERHQDQQAVGASLILLGAIEEDRQEYGKAIHHYEMAMQVYPGLDILYWIIIRIGLCHSSARNYPEALRAFEASLESGRQLGASVRIGWSLANIGETLILQSRYAEALPYLEQACGSFEQVHTRFGVMWANHSMARACMALKDFAQARRHAGMALDLANDVLSTIWIAKSKELLAEIDALSNKVPLPVPDLGPDGLSPRELEILQLLKSELTGPEIADRLVVSVNTFRFHTKNIYEKLGVNNRLEAIRRAKELGL